MWPKKKTRPDYLATCSALNCDNEDLLTEPLQSKLGDDQLMDVGWLKLTLDHQKVGRSNLYYCPEHRNQITSNLP